MAKQRIFKLTAETRTPFVNPGLFSPSPRLEPRPAPADAEQEQTPPDAPEADAPSGATD